MMERKQDKIARSLNAMKGWTRPGPPLPFAFYALVSNRLQKVTLRSSAATAPTMPRTPRTVQSSVDNRNNGASRRSNSFRGAAQSNPRPALDCSMTTRLDLESHWLTASEAER